MRQILLAVSLLVSAMLVVDAGVGVVKLPPNFQPLPSIHLNPPGPPADSENPRPVDPKQLMMLKELLESLGGPKARILNALVDLNNKDTRSVSDLNPKFFPNSDLYLSNFPTLVNLLFGGNLGNTNANTATSTSSSVKK